MDLLAEVLQDDARRRHDKCAVAVTVDKLDEPLRSEVQAAIDHPEATHAAIARALERRGVTRPDGRPLRQDQIGRHRKGSCACSDRL